MKQWVDYHMPKSTYRRDAERAVTGLSRVGDSRSRAGSVRMPWACASLVVLAFGGAQFTPAAQAQPVISNLTAAPACITATLSWSTDSAADSLVNYGLTSSYTDSAADGAIDTLHTVTLPSLRANTTYHFQVTSTDGNGNVVVSSDQTFTTRATPLHTTPASSIVSGREFAADSYVHKPLADNAPLDPNSAAWVANLTGQIRQYYSVTSVNISTYSPQIYIAEANQPTVRVATSAPDWNNFQIYDPLQDQFNAVPVPDDFAPAAGTDREAVIYQPATGHYWDLWGIQKTGQKVSNSAGQSVNEWRVDWGGKVDNISTIPGYFPRTAWGSFGTQATSLAFLAGIITIADQRAGVINHPLFLTIPETSSDGWTWPAQSTDGYIAGANAIPQGTAFRLPANLNLNAMDMDPYARMLAKAVQKYGMYVSDTAGSVAFRAENPGTRYAVDPYTSPGGILNCPSNFDPGSSDVCQPIGLASTEDTGWGANGRLRGFPWDKLQALQTNLISWDQAPIDFCTATSPCPDSVH